MPGRTSPAAVLACTCACRSTVSGANRQALTASSAEGRWRRSAHNARIFLKPRTMLWIAMPVPCTPARSPLTRSASSRRERRSCPVALQREQTERIARAHRIVEIACGLEAVGIADIVLVEQAPDRLLRGRA